MLPDRIYLSKKATERLRYLKMKTGVTPNIMARIAIMLAINEGSNLRNSGISDFEGQELNKSTLFGENSFSYDVFISQYVHDFKIELPLAQVVATLVEVGVFKLGHIKTLSDLCELG